MQTFESVPEISAADFFSIDKFMFIQVWEFGILL